MDDMIASLKEDIETFILSGTLGDEWPKGGGRGVTLVNNEVHCSDPARHAEINAAPSILKFLNAHEEIVMYINYTPCSVCAKKVQLWHEEKPEVPLTIKCAYVYFPRNQANRDGLKKLMTTPNITLETIGGADWMVVMQRMLESHGKRYWKMLLNQILEEHWASGWERGLQEIKSSPAIISYSEIFLEDGKEKWEGDLEAILRDNWAKGKEKILTEIWKHRRQDQWVRVLLMILEHQGKDGWRATMVELLKNQFIPQSQAPGRNGMYSANARDEQGYVWLKVLLDALDIEVRKEWEKQRRRTDISAARELNSL